MEEAKKLTSSIFTWRRVMPGYFIGGEDSMTMTGMQASPCWSSSPVKKLQSFLKFKILLAISFILTKITVIYAVVADNPPCFLVSFKRYFLIVV